METLKRSAQIIKCKCGSVFAACVEPECYTDVNWMKDVRKYVKKGCTIETVDTNIIKFEECKCKKTTNINNQSLFLD